jgi:RNA polymerase sigma factor (sigma-70 family)
MDPWRAKLEESDAVAAWDLFIEQYRRLILATIRQLAREHDDVLDVFACVCEALHANDLARLRHFTESQGQRASFSTWLVTVVRNQAIDWLRHRDGRPRPSVPPTLSPVQRQILEHLGDGRSHVEAYELIRTRDGSPMSFGAFLRELRETYLALGASHRVVTRRRAVAVSLSDVAGPADPPPAAEASERIARALESLTPNEQLAVQLFVVDEMSAAEVARTVGWPNAKRVYNGVYRALVTLREALERQGIRRGDL